MTAIALGFRVKSGYAVAIAVRGPASAPTLVARRIVELCDPAVAQTRQPYHADLHAHEPDRGALERRIAIVKRCANQSIAALLNTDVFADAGCGGAALVVGSVIDPASVANPHIRAHASEGALFRDVFPLMVKYIGHDREELLAEAEKVLFAHNVVKEGDLIVLTIGEPIGKAGGTNTMKIVKAGEHYKP